MAWPRWPSHQSPLTAWPRGQLNFPAAEWSLRSAALINAHRRCRRRRWLEEATPPHTPNPTPVSSAQRGRGFKKIQGRWREQKESSLLSWGKTNPMKIVADPNDPLQHPPRLTSTGTMLTKTQPPLDAIILYSTAGSFSRWTNVAFVLFLHLTNIFILKNFPLQFIKGFPGGAVQHTIHHKAAAFAFEASPCILADVHRKGPVNIWRDLRVSGLTMP